jgi:hypothetical protein
MDVKSAFLNGPIQELVYVEQAPRVWYECLKEFLLKQGFEIGKADPVTELSKL